MKQPEQTTQTKGSDQPLTEKIKNREEGDTIEVNCLDETLTVLSTSPLVCFEVRLRASDGTEYNLRETLLDDDVLEIEPRRIFSEPIIVRELEVVE